MRKKSLGRTIALYVSMLVVSITLLVGWIIYVVYFSARLTELVERIGGRSLEGSQWMIMSIGIVMFVILIVGLSLQLALSISDVRYNQKQNEFVANITHELKSPLAAIRLHAQSLQQPDLTHAEINASLDHILKQEKRMSALIENIIEISRLQSKLRFKIEPAPIFVNDFLQSYAEEIRPKITSHNMNFVLKTDSPLSIMASLPALHRILDNLIDNAIKASQSDSTITIKSQNKERFVEIVVQDEGCGINKTDQKKIFNRFYQIGSEIRGRRSGTGLGLAIVKELVKEMGGKIKVESNEDIQGSKFVILFPIIE